MQSTLFIVFLIFYFSEKPEDERQPTSSASDLLKAHEKEIKRHKFSQPTSTSVSSSSSNKQDTPMLGRGLAPGSDIFFDESPNVKKRKSSDLDRAKVCLVIGVSTL